MESTIKNQELQNVQKQVDQVVDIMHKNLEKITERDETLRDLEKRVDVLEDTGKIWKTRADLLRKKYWWKNTKMLIMVAVVVIFVLLIIFVSCTYYLSDDVNPESSTKSS